MQDLKPDQLDELRLSLQDAKRSIIDLLAATESDAQPISEQEPIGRLTRADAMQQQGVLIANRTLAKNRLKLIGIALNKMADDDYGYCTDCGNTIDFLRLQSSPEVECCLGCQSTREQKT